jgi:predicted ester cyclase
MTRERARAFFDERQAHWHAQDADALANGHALTGTIISPIFGRRSGRDGIRQSYQSLFTIFPDWAFVSEAPILDGARMALPFSVTATHVGEFMGVAGTNRKFHIRGVMLIEMGDDGIQAEERLYDFTGFLIQVGVLRAKPGKD